MKRPAKLSHLALHLRALRAADTELAAALQLETTSASERALLACDRAFLQSVIADAAQRVAAQVRR